VVDTTVIGNVGGVVVTVPFTSSQNSSLAQLALDSLNAGTIPASAFYVPTVSDPNATVSATTQAVYVTVPGYTAFNALPSSTTLLTTDGNNTVAAIGSSSPTTVLGGENSSIVFINNDTNPAVPSQIFLGGGNNYIAEGSSLASAVINVDGSTETLPQAASGTSGPGLGGAYIDGSQGSTTVNMYANANVNMVLGGHDLINLVASTVNGGSTDLLAISGPSTVPATITAAAGTNLWLIDNANAFIEPAGGNVVIMPGGTGSATLFGGAASVFGGTGTVPAFTGAATVYGGTGYFQGGTGGRNVLEASSISGASATLVGGGSSNTLIGGASSTNNDSVLGSTVGGNVIGFGAGVDTAIGYGGNASTAGLTGNTYAQYFAGGTDIITDFKVGQDFFSLTWSSAFEGASTAITTTSFTTLQGGGTEVKLSDGSKIDFLHVTVTQTSFS